MADDKKRNSVLNNSYKTGEKLQGDSFEFYNSVKVDEVASSTFMRDSCNFESIYYMSMAEKLRELLVSNKTLHDLVLKYDEKDIKKFDKYDINIVFHEIYEYFTKDKDFKYFFNVYYAFYLVSDVTSVGFDVIFNSLNYENRLPVVEELFNDGCLTL